MNWKRLMKHFHQNFVTVILLLIIQSIERIRSAGHGPNAVRINKCCENVEIIIDDLCTLVNDTKLAKWIPQFTNYDGYESVKVDEYYFAIGLPNCGTKQMFKVYHGPTRPDKLVLLPNGKLRHYTRNPSEIDDVLIEKTHEPLYYDHDQGKYCLQKAMSSNGVEQLFANVCNPKKGVHWTDTDFMLRKIINPICHGLAISTLLLVAIIYFVLPTLRDLVGNIITTITICLIVSQAANLVRIYTEFSNHVSFLVADLFMYVSLLAAFFWLNSLGYYIWKTFRSRNVFLRVTDGRKYCWYSGYAWGSTVCLAFLAIFSHFFLDTTASKQNFVIDEQETIGWLGIAVFFTPIAFTIIMDIFFFVTTQQIINRMNTYGRIHHKLKANFVMYSLLFIIMTIAWLFLILSWLQFDGLLYAHIIVNAIQAPFILYVCVLRQKHVTFLLKKSCCYNEPPAPSDWGDEMEYMNGGNY